MSVVAADLPALAKRRRHSWDKDNVERPDPFHTYRRCTYCGCLKVSRHEGDRHWIEYDDGDKIHRTAPPCQ